MLTQQPLPDAAAGDSVLRFMITWLVYMQQSQTVTI
jgi:hypothetical protein